MKLSIVQLALTVSAVTGFSSPTSPNNIFYPPLLQSTNKYVAGCSHVSGCQQIHGKSSIVLSMTTTLSNDDKDTTNQQKIEESTGSTAIILNMNARSVTPQLITIASNIVGEENVFVTKTADEAKLAAKTVVSGCCNNDTTSKKYSLVIPVGGDGTLSGWINTMVDEILLFHKEMDNTTDKSTIMSVEDALQMIPLVGYIPMGTGNGLGYVIGCKAGNKDDNNSDQDDIKKKKSVLSRINFMSWMKRHGKVERARLTMQKLKTVGDTVQEAERRSQSQKEVDFAETLSGTCSIVQMPVMEVTHPRDNDDEDDGAIEDDMKGDLCFFAGAGFDSLMLNDFKMIKAWAISDKYGPHALPWFVKDSLSSVAGYVVALITKTLPQALWYGTHKIHVDVTTTDKDTLWVDHRRGDFSELAVATSDKSTTTASSTTQQQQHMIYSGTTGIIAAATTPYYGGGMRLFPYARLIPDKLQLRVGRISPLTGFVNIPAIFEGSYREKTNAFGCLDFIGRDFEVEVRSARYDEYVKRKSEKKGKKRRRLLNWLRLRRRSEDSNDDTADTDKEPIKRVRGFPFQHSGESMGCKERFRLRVVQQSVSFVSFLEPRVIIDD